MTKTTSKYDAVIIGAGAAGLMAAVQAGARGRKVLLIEHTDKVGEKIRISGGGRCNFTNLHAPFYEIGSRGLYPTRLY